MQKLCHGNLLADNMEEGGASLTLVNFIIL